MKYLSDKGVYLCGPLHACADDGIGWRKQITPQLMQYGLTILDPTQVTVSGLGEVGDDKARFKQLIREEKWLEAKQALWPIVRRDLRMVDKADFLILNYAALSPTIGTWNEITIASMQKKPILLKYDKSELDNFNIWVLSFIKPNCIFSEWDDLFAYLDKINSGEFDTSYWTM